jgi:hypothetical protein
MRGIFISSALGIVTFPILYRYGMNATNYGWESLSSGNALHLYPRGNEFEHRTRHGLSQLRQIPGTTSIKPLPLSPKSFPNKHILIKLSSDAIRMVSVATASLNNKSRCEGWYGEYKHVWKCYNLLAFGIETSHIDIETNSRDASFFSFELLRYIGKSPGVKFLFIIPLFSRTFQPQFNTCTSLDNITRLFMTFLSLTSFVLDFTFLPLLLLQFLFFCFPYQTVHTPTIFAWPTGIIFQHRSYQLHPSLYLK